MTRGRRRRGFFEGLPRVVYRRTGARYFAACAAAVVGNGIVVSGFGVIALALYVNLSARELALFAACTAVGFAVEGAVAALYLLRAAEPPGPGSPADAPRTACRRHGRLRQGCRWRSCDVRACT
jgi:hypothetical protein